MRSEADKLARFPGDAQTKDINSNPTAAALKFVYGISMVKYDVIILRQMVKAHQVLR